MANILILLSGHLCTCPRAQKEAEVLASAGHDITVRGVWFDEELIRRDRLLIVDKKWRFEPTVDFSPRLPWKNLQLRLQGRIAREGFRRFGIFSPETLGYGAKKMLAVARSAGADLTIVHSEAGLWVGSKLLEEGFRVGVDFEDWFSEKIEPEQRACTSVRKLKELEERLVRNCRYCLIPSYALATAIAKSYHAPEPAVVYNAFSWAERDQLDGENKDRCDTTLPSLHWFSQTIGKNRGLEMMVEALAYLTLPLEVHLRGNLSESIRRWFDSLIPKNWRDRIFIHPTVPNAELLSRIAEHDIGLALENNNCLNRSFVVSNKLMQYLLAGLAVIATDTVGQKEVFLQYPDMGRIIPVGEPLALAHAIEDLISAPENLKQAKEAALRAAREKFCWEKQKASILKAAEEALGE